VGGTQPPNPSTQNPTQPQPNICTASTAHRNELNHRRPRLQQRRVGQVGGVHADEERGLPHRVELLQEAAAGVVLDDAWCVCGGVGWVGCLVVWLVGRLGWLTRVEMRYVAVATPSTIPAPLFKSTTITHHTQNQPFEPNITTRSPHRPIAPQQLQQRRLIQHPPVGAKR